MSEAASQTPSPSPGPRPAPWTLALVWVTVLLIVTVFWDTVSLIALIFLTAAAIAALLRPLAQRIGRRTAVAGSLVGVGFWALTAIVLGVTGVLFAMPIRRQIEQWPQIQETLDETLARISEAIGIDGEITFERLAANVLEWVAVENDNGLLTQAIGGAGVAIVGVVLVIFGSIFMLTAPAGQLTQPLTKLLPPPWREPMLLAIGDIDKGLRWWLIGILVSVAAVALLAWIGFTIVGIEMALPLALLAGLGEFVPFLGPTVAFAVAALFALAEGMPQFIGVVIVWAIIQTIEPYLLVPMIMRRAVHMPPLITIFTVIIWARIFGPLGLLLAIPINLVIWAVLNRFIIERNA